jgi:hypothetical protein
LVVNTLKVRSATQRAVCGVRPVRLRTAVEHAPISGGQEIGISGAKHVQSGIL